MDKQLFLTRLKKHQRALIVNHLLLLMQVFLMLTMPINRTLAIVCTAVTALATASVWYAVFKK